MADIFISYSSKDREQAGKLIEMLGAAGVSVWIDQHGIDLATSWSGEIVDAIENCSALILLLSQHSVASVNVVKEVALAAELGKKIVPLDLEPVELSRDLRYHLAGIQRAPLQGIDPVLRALARSGGDASTQARSPKIVRETLGRKSLMILPFEDLSPTQDNGWFTDGIASELVNTLSKIRALKVIDWNTSRMLKQKSITTVELAREFDVRYFIQGQVRKSGEQIKISISLLDIESGDHLWHESLRGTMDDIFDIEEQCASKVVEGLRLHLTVEEQATVRSKPTENAEAYEVWLKGSAFHTRNTKLDLERALAHYEEAARLDPTFSQAYSGIANMATALYQRYDKREALLDQANAASERVRELEGETARYHWVMSRLAFARGDREEALQAAIKSVTADGAYAPGYDALGHAYIALGRIEEAAAAREEGVRLLENYKAAHFNLLATLQLLGTTAGAKERLRAAAERALPVFERHLRLDPEDHHTRLQLAMALHYAEREAEALGQNEILASIPTLDSLTLYNLACLFMYSSQPARSLDMLERSVEAGYANLDNLRRDPDFDPLRGMPRFEELLSRLEANGRS